MKAGKYEAKRIDALAFKPIRPSLGVFSGNTW